MPRGDKSNIGRGPPSLAKAHALWAERRFDEAVRQFNRAVREAPENLRVLLEASRALGKRYHMDRSMALLEKAQRLGARRPEVQHAVGETYRTLNRPALAEACFRRACRLDSAPASRLELARLCERRHALEEAESLVASVVAAEPRSFAARLLAARILRRRGKFDAAETMLRQLTRATNEDPRLLAEAYGELCTLFDATGHYDSAWAAIAECKRLQLEQSDAAWTAAQFVVARCRRMVDGLTREHFALWEQPVSDDATRRVALLTGFPRSGTTLLEQVLDAHPDVVSSEEKDVFGADVFVALGEGRPADSSIIELLDEASNEKLVAARRSYLAAMEAMLGEPLGQRLHVDKNPTMNLMIPSLRRVFPELKLIVALRDPRDVVTSAFLRFLPINPISACFLTLERTADRYAVDMGAWLKMRDLVADWVEVRYEDAVRELRGEAQRMLAALGLPWEDAVLDYRGRALQKPVQSPTYEQVAQPVYDTSIGRWRNYQRHLEPVLEKLSPMLKALGYAG